MKTGRKVNCCVAGAVLLGLASSPAGALNAPKQAPENNEKLCAEQTSRQEREAGIPEHLLAAISLTESGRWHAERRANVAWPWTVTAEGQGRFFPSKDEAIAEVRNLQARGVTNIDVGCMQVNLYHHKEAFANLDQALDPAGNVAYAARYLKEMYALTGSWQDAAGAYHSMDPDRGLVYQAKVLKFWSEAVGGVQVAAIDPRKAPDAAAATPTASGSQVKAPVPIDWSRTAELNARLRLSRADDPGAAARAAIGSADHLRVMRHAAAGLNDRPIPAETGRALAVAQADRPGFAEKRQAQLKLWRERP